MSSAGVLSDIFGVLSFVGWITAVLPQEYENYQRKSVEGLSLMLFLLLTSGDILNLIGCILNHQIFFLKLNSAYSLFSDFVILFQYWLYKDNHGEVFDGASVVSYGSISSATSSKKSLASTIIFASAQVAKASAMPLNMAARPSFDTSRIIAYGCAVCYISSRIPQLLKNHQRKTTDGVSVMYFIIVSFALFASAMSILTSNQVMFNDDYASKIEFLWLSCPWLVSNFGCLIMNFVFFAQFYYYDCKRSVEFQQFLA